MLGIDLSTAYQKSLNYNADYLKAQASNDAGQEFQVQGKSQLLPQITAGANLNSSYLTSSGMSVTYYQPSVQAQIQQVVFDFNKISAYSKSKFATQLSDLQMTNAKQKLIVTVGQAYFDLLYAEDSLEAVKMTKNALGKQLEQATRSFKVGTVTIADVNDAQSGYDTSAAQEIQAENELINQKNNFNNTTGLNPELVQPIVESLDLVSPTPDDVDEWAHMAKTSNLDILVAMKQVDMSLEDINIAKSGHLPIVSFTGSYQLQGTANLLQTDSAATEALVNQLASTPGFPMSNYTGLGAMLQVSIPISSGGGVSSQVRQQMSTYEATRDQLLNTQREIDQKIRYAFLQVHNGVELVKAQTQALKSAKIKLESDKTGYSVGIRNSINLVNAQKDYYQTWQSYNETKKYAKIMFNHVSYWFSCL